MTSIASPPQQAPPPASASDLPDAPVPASTRPTPVTLRRLAVACVVTAILAGIFISVASFQRASRLNDAAAKTQQLVVLTDARSQMAAAHAAATRAFLVGGVEDAEGRDAYLAAVDAATSDLNAAAASGIGDTAAIASIAEGVGAYRGTIEYARALNRQNLPLGSAYLRSAGDGLATEVVEPLDAEIASVRGSIQTNAPPVTVALATIAVLAFAACFVWSSVLLLRHTRRYLNVGVVLGGGLVVVVLLAFLVATVGITSTVNDAVDGPLRDTTQIAQARADVFDARSSMNLALIARGSGATFLARVDDDLADARTRLGSVVGTDGNRLDTALEDFSEQLQVVRDADSGGDYAEAVRLATVRDEGVGPAFDAFDQVSAQVLAARAAEADDALTSGRPWLLVLTVAAVLAGVLGAAAAWSGIGQRRKEYM
ncbi:MAG TPA: hypothetical protein VIY72_09480 [Acidimicrobiales bacterium]